MSKHFTKCRDGLGGYSAGHYTHFRPLRVGIYGHQQHFPENGTCVVHVDSLPWHCGPGPGVKWCLGGEVL